MKCQPNHVPDPMTVRLPQRAVNNPLAAGSAKSRREWIAHVGPTAWCLHTELIERLTGPAMARGDELKIDLAELGVCLGVKPDQVRRTIARLVNFGWATPKLHVLVIHDRLELPHRRSKLQQDAMEAKL